MAAKEIVTDQHFLILQRMVVLAFFSWINFLSLALDSCMIFSLSFNMENKIAGLWLNNTNIHATFVARSSLVPITWPVTCFCIRERTRSNAPSVQPHSQELKAWGRSKSGIFLNTLNIVCEITDTIVEKIWELFPDFWLTLNGNLQSKKSRNHSNEFMKFQVIW